MMKVCASLSSCSEKDRIQSADMVEIRLDLLGKIPDIKNKELLVTYRGNIDLSILPRGYSGMLDIGEEKRPSSKLTILASHHDFERTPDAEDILSILNKMDSDISKGAFSVKSFKDLHNIWKAATSLKKRHVILGMNELGTITRVRQNILENEFTFGYVGEPTAPGQLSVTQMKELGDDCMITGLIGHPLSKSMSPAMHNAAFKNTGINGIYLKFDSDNLENACDVIREYNIRGINVTIPYKQDIMEQLDSVDDDTRTIGAVNTIVNDNGKLKGYNTDVKGIEKALEISHFDTSCKRALILGSGGAARACAFILKKKGCRVTITGRNSITAKKLADDIDCEYKPGNSIPINMHDLIVNCTPIGMYDNGEYPIRLEHLSKNHTVFDMVYGHETPILAKASSVKAKTVSGTDMLAGQGSASFELWTGQKDQFEIMRRVLE